VRIGTALVGLAACGLAVACGSETEPEKQWPDVEVDPTPVVLKRLTTSQYESSIRDLVGDVAVPINLEPDASYAGFLVVGGAQSSISALGVERYESAAYEIAEQAMDDPEIVAELVPCDPKGAEDEGCFGQFVTQFGRRAFRRPLTDAETGRYVDVALQAASKLGEFYDGIEFAMAGMLMSPHFLFRVELGTGEGGKLRYSDYEMASRLSFFLWNTTPDDELLDAAERGELTDLGTLAHHVDRLLASDRAREGVRNFFAERFELHELDDLVKDGEIFTEMSAELGPDAREETLRTVEDLVFDRDADYRDLFTSRKTFVNRKLASLYNVPAPALDDFGPTTLPEDSARVGLLGHASVLALHAHSTSTSATLRGLFVRTTLLCGTIPPPPADVDTSLPEADETFPTLRDRIDQHLTDPACSSCHLIVDPIGLGLEQFDGLGKFRLTENGYPIDASGDLDGSPFEDAETLGEAIAHHPDVASCLTRHLYRYAIAQEERGGDEALIDQLTEQFAYDGYRIKPLLRRIALSDGFRYGKEGE
jgi:hypothetical protein